MEILQENTALFNEHEIGAYVYPFIQGKAEEHPISLSENGTLGIPTRDCRRITGFRLGGLVPKDAPVVIRHRNLRHIRQAPYHSHALLSLIRGEWKFWDTGDIPLRVYRKEGISWTVWQAIVPNRVDFWFLTPGGLVTLFQVGVIARGETDGRELHFRLLGELRGEWQLSRDPQRKVAGIPTNPVWGTFDVRRSILSDSDFQTLLNKAHLPSWSGSEEELNSPLKLPSEPNQAVMNWWSPFTGRRGQGPIYPENSNAWVCGEDFLDEADPDGIVRLPRGTYVSYQGIEAVEHGTQRSLSEKEVQRLQREGGKFLRKLLEVRRIQ